MMANKGPSAAFLDSPKIDVKLVPKRLGRSDFSECYSNPQSGGFQRGQEVSFLRSMTSLEVVKIMIFLMKIKDFEAFAGSAIELSSCRFFLALDPP